MKIITYCRGGSDGHFWITNCERDECWLILRVTRVLSLNGFRKKVVKMVKISCLSIGSNAFDRDMMISVSRLPLMLARVLSAAVIVQFAFTFYSTFRLDCLDDIRKKKHEEVKSFIIVVSHHRQLFLAFAISSWLLCKVIAYVWCVEDWLHANLFVHRFSTTMVLTSGGALSHIHDGLVAFQPDAKSLWEWNLRNIFPSSLQLPTSTCSLLPSNISHSHECQKLRTVFIYTIWLHRTRERETGPI